MENLRRSFSPSFNSCSSHPPLSPFLHSLFVLLEHRSKAEKLIHAKKSNSILIEMNIITSYHRKYANDSPCV